MPVTFPENGRSRAEIQAALDAMAEGDADWRGGRVPLYVFGATAEVAEVGRAAFNAYFTENALGGAGRSRACVGWRTRSSRWHSTYSTHRRGRPGR